MHTRYFRSHWLAAGKQLAMWQWMANQSAPLEEMQLILQLQNVISLDIYRPPSKTHAQPQACEASLCGFFLSVLGFSGTICFLGVFTISWCSFRKATCKKWSACPLLRKSGLRAGLAFPPEGKIPIAQIHSCPSLVSVVLSVLPRNRRSAWYAPGLRIAMFFWVFTQPHHSPVRTPQPPNPSSKKRW